MGFYNKDTYTVMMELKTHESTGLTQKEAEARLRKYGNNELN